MRESMYNHTHTPFLSLINIHHSHSRSPPPVFLLSLPSPSSHSFFPHHASHAFLLNLLTNNHHVAVCHFLLLILFCLSSSHS
uniref:Uncharacterized protein n=1 Tax=Octopus bimaculoides TaxID=37653 RepID=A0A0L8GND6_OCTBM